MQRINLWPNPDFVPSGFHTSGSGKDLAEYMSAGRFANTSPDYIDLPFASCELGAEYVCCFNISATVAVKNIAIWSGSGSWKPQAQTVGMQTIRFVPAAADTRLGVPPGMTIDSLIVELADTFDETSGGASGLLLGGHDATRLRRFVGRVMSDDGDEPMHEPILDNHPASRQVGPSHDRSERERDDILGQFRCERHRRHCLVYRNTGRIQRTPTCQLHDVRLQFQSAISELFRQVRQSDRHRDKYTHLHVGRVSVEQDPARRHRIFRRGYDAARLTLLGVVA